MLEKSDHCKYLGMQIDENLKYNEHIELLCTKIAKLCSISYRIRNDLNLKSAKNVYFSCIYSILTYCICVYGGVLQCTSRGDRLINLHKRSVKNLFGRFGNRNVCIFKNMGILKLVDIHKFYVAIYMYKVLKMNLCPTLQMNLDINTPSHHYETRHRNDLILPFPRVIALRINFKYQCNNVWNNIPDEIKNCTSLKCFKRNLTNHFLDQY